MKEKEQEPLVPFMVLYKLEEIMVEKGFTIKMKQNSFYLYEPNATEPFASLVYDDKEFKDDNTKSVNNRAGGELGEYPRAFIEGILRIIEERENRSRARIATSEERENRSRARIATSEERENRSRAESRRSGAVVEGSESLVQESGFLQEISNSNLWRGDYQQNHRGIQELKQLEAQEKELLNNVALRAYLKNSSDEYSSILEVRLFHLQKQSFIEQAKKYNEEKNILYPDDKEKKRIKLAEEYLKITQNPLSKTRPFKSEEIDIIAFALEIPSINKKI